MRLVALPGLAFAVAMGFTLVGSPVAAAARIPLTNSDGGRTIKADVGDTVEVRLTAYTDQGRRWVWDEPKHSGAGVLNRLRGATESNGNARAVFEVTGSGREDVTAQRICVKSAECPKTADGWKVTIRVD
ncbi:hypothetical protein [Nocardia mexicana]|uniref:Secreted protein n=1 Tax=Nocardia mexicana TaxID=279262 RepID=A0A370H4G1_9NOCA|nr:hypothetical protein [Nocardia mexicana]RDI50132.1 hypothetical protein DFR68_106571 [Nocardia mexicana]